VATVTPVLWRHKANARGHHPLWLRFGDGSRTLYASLGVYLHPRFWNENAARVRKTYELHEEVNQLIEARLADAERARLRLLTAREVVTAEGLKEAVFGRGHSGCLLDYARAFLDAVERQGNVQRARKERAVLAKLEEFAGSPLPFRRLTPAFLDRWTSWLLAEKKNKASTVAAGITVLRLHFNRAVRHGIVSAADSPFPNYKPPRIQKPERTKLTAEQVAAIERLDLGPGGPTGSGVAKVRDWFMFSLYAQGMRFSDVLQLRRRNVGRDEQEGGAVYRVRYRMGKTGKPSAVLLVPQALALIEPYLQREGAPDAYLFDALDRYDTSTPAGLLQALSSRNAYANKVLRQIAERAGVDVPVSMHVARHTFADLARKGGWSVYDISKGLGHGGLAVTTGYLAGFDAEALDERMRGLFTRGG
jgi:integrase/recombinase XerD